MKLNNNFLALKFLRIKLNLTSLSTSKLNGRYANYFPTKKKTQIRKNFYRDEIFLFLRPLTKIKIKNRMHKKKSSLKQRTIKLLIYMKKKMWKIIFNSFLCKNLNFSSAIFSTIFLFIMIATYAPQKKLITIDFLFSSNVHFYEIKKSEKWTFLKLFWNELLGQK